MFIKDDTKKRKLRFGSKRKSLIKKKFKNILEQQSETTGIVDADCNLTRPVNFEKTHNVYECNLPSGISCIKYLDKINSSRENGSTSTKYINHSNKFSKSIEISRNDMKIELNLDENKNLQKILPTMLYCDVAVSNDIMKKSQLSLHGEIDEITDLVCGTKHVSTEFPSDCNLYLPINQLQKDAFKVKQISFKEIITRFPSYCHGKPSNILYCKNWKKNDLFLVEIFSSYEGFVKIDVPKSGRMRNQAFVHFKNVDYASSALNRFNGIITDENEKPLILCFSNNNN
ncbi:hypothetical protein A3Q56_02915 [Intoshia linei]|uniref:RRM domain-containing protein n=1 Tax=Intoshia linei TaxID=1819745 RepID=A0A177B787_9BILA|nr:hypothetical protein A3Q56_02915 [Intoshia linei]